MKVYDIIKDQFAGTNGVTYSDVQSAATSAGGTDAKVEFKVYYDEARLTQSNEGEYKVDESGKYPCYLFNEGEFDVTVGEGTAATTAHHINVSVGYLADDIITGVINA